MLVKDHKVPFMMARKCKLPGVLGGNSMTLLHRYVEFREEVNKGKEGTTSLGCQYIEATLHYLNRI